jgi:small subunit ribosomal protein S19e
MASRGVTVKDVAAQDFVRAYAKHLKRSGRVPVPKWVDIAKTGTHKQLPPRDPDWFFVRTASVARKLYIRGGTGTGALRKVYGGAKHNGVSPSHFSTSSGSVVRNVLKGLEKMGVLEKDPKG